jgi:hypothetical protein
MKYTIDDLKLEHCYQCPYMRGVKKFKCYFTKKEVSPYPKNAIPNSCPLPDTKDLSGIIPEKEKPVTKHLHMGLSVITYTPSELQNKILDLCAEYKVQGTSVQWSSKG